jgi:DNA polymerase III subunit gamma/tau
MSYQVIARKWRPRDFEELVGQEHVSRTLLNALRNGRLHHALLFTGPRGTGKTSTARILAKALRCPNSKDYVPCHVCPECEEIAAGRSLNVIEIDGASNNGVDAIRELRETVGYMPSSGKYKLYIIDEVHMLSTAAFNALLKTLEEPPGHVEFVMATTEAHKIPETILSRVQRFDFRCIPTRLIVKHLENICQAENIKFEPEALWTIARQGAGSMRDSQSFLDQAVTFAGDDLTLEKVTGVLGLTDRRLLLACVRALVEQNAADAIAVLEKVFTAGYEPHLFMQDLLEEIRHLLMINLTQGQPGAIVDLADSEVQELAGLGKQIGADDIHLLFDMALKGAQDLHRAPDARVALEMAVLRMTQAPRMISLQEYLASGVQSGPQNAADGMRNAESRTQNSEAKAPEKPAAPVVQRAGPSKPANVASLTGAAPGSHDWFFLVERIKGVNSVIGAQLENCFLKEIKDKKIVLGCSAKMKFLADKLSGTDFKKKVLNYVSTFWGPGYQLEVVGGDGDETSTAAAMTPKAQAAKQQEDERQQLRRQVEEHPMVKSAQALFKTEIRSIKENKQ